MGTHEVAGVSSERRYSNWSSLLLGHVGSIFRPLLAENVNGWNCWFLTIIHKLVLQFTSNLSYVLIGSVSRNSFILGYVCPISALWWPKMCKGRWNWWFLTTIYKTYLSVHFKLCTLFIRPFEKRTYYAMAMSVRPSVRPSFPDFFSTCFEISIWNLVYALSRWHDMSSLSFITIGSLWPSLQPKVGQTQFLQSWPYKSR